jgi:hypothetical protein
MAPVSGELIIQPAEPEIRRLMRILESACSQTAATERNQRVTFPRATVGFHPSPNWSFADHCPKPLLQKQFGNGANSQFSTVGKLCKQLAFGAYRSNVSS